MKDVHASNETRDASQMSIATMFKPKKRPRLIEQETSADIDVEGEQLDPFISFLF